MGKWKTKKHTKDNIERLPSTPGVYKLKYGDRIVYISATDNLKASLLKCTMSQRFVGFVWREIEDIQEAYCLANDLIRAETPRRNKYRGWM